MAESTRTKSTQAMSGMKSSLIDAGNPPPSHSGCTLTLSNILTETPTSPITCVLGRRSVIWKNCIVWSSRQRC